MKPFLGIDIGGTKCAVCVARVDGGIDIIKKLRFDSKAYRGFETMIGDIFAAADELAGDKSLCPFGVGAIGISCGGPLDSKSGTVLCPPNLPGWINVPIVEMFSKRYGVPSFVMNDANACALAEWKMGAGRGSDNMVFLTMGTGMGGGVIANGRLLSGASDMAGEIGHLRLSESGPMGFGKHGSFEGFCSGGGIASQAKEKTIRLIENGSVPAWTKDGYTEEEINVKLLSQYARKGDKDALGIFDEVGFWLGRGLSLIADMFNPERIVIGSIYSRCEDLLKDSMEKSLKSEAISYSYEALKVLPAETGESLGDYAAIMVALYNLGIEPSYSEVETDAEALEHFVRLFERYPALCACKSDIMQAYIALRDCFFGGSKLMLCGNGGSASDCEHIVGELMKGFYLKRRTAKQSIFEHLQGALPAISLTGHASLSTAFANDVDPKYVFAQQIYGLGRKGDALIAISTSGNSENVALAAKTAKELGIKTIGLSGESGGKLNEICDVCVKAPASSPADVQEYHLPIYHALCAMLEAKFFKE